MKNAVLLFLIGLLLESPIAHAQHSASVNLTAVVEISRFTDKTTNTRTYKTWYEVQYNVYIHNATDSVIAVPTKGYLPRTESTSTSTKFDLRWEDRYLEDNLIIAYSEADLNVTKLKKNEVALITWSETLLDVTRLQTVGVMLSVPKEWGPRYNIWQGNLETKADIRNINKAKPDE